MDYFVWKQLLKYLVLPPTGPLLLAALGLVLVALRRRRLGGAVLCALGLALLWVLATPIAADSLVRWAERYPALNPAQVGDAQSIVILAGGVRVDAPEYGTSAPGATSLERLVYGARLARQTHLPVLISGSRFETASMDDFLQQDLGVTARWLENRSRDTHQNAQFSAAILAREGVHKVVLVTSAAHMARSVVEFNQAGIDTVPAPGGHVDPAGHGSPRLRAQCRCPGALPARHVRGAGADGSGSSNPLPLRRGPDRDPSSGRCGP